APRTQRAPGGRPRARGRQRRAARGRQTPPGHAPGHRACRPRHRLRADLARHRRRPRPRRVPRRHHHPRGRRWQRRQPVEQEPAAVRMRGDRHPAGAGDPRRRGQGRARRDRGPARSGRDVLPALARAARRRRAPPAHRGLHARAAGRDRLRRAALGAGGAAGRRAGVDGGRAMNAAAPSPARDGAAVDWARVREDFPLLRREVNGKPLLYFDSANTGQKPAAVIEAVDAFYRRHNANVSRAVHTLGGEATELYEDARRKLASFTNVRADELVLCSGTTFAINLVAYSWALPRLKAGDAILLTRMEHHANIVPWQLVAQRTGARIDVVELLPDGSLDLGMLRTKMTADVKLLAVAHVSNVLGTVNPVREICHEARKRGIVTVVDGSQALPHRPVDIAAIGCDFYALTGHKMCGPTGTGALW